MAYNMENQMPDLNEFFDFDAFPNALAEEEPQSPGAGDL